jgi:hypothetical protein
VKLHGLGRNVERDGDFFGLPALGEELQNFTLSAR